MSSYGASIWDKTHPYPERKGKMYGPKTIDNLDTRTQHSHFPRRMREDDSDAVNMSDQTLGGGIRDFTKA